MSDSDHRRTTSIIKSDRTGRTRYTRQYKQDESLIEGLLSKTDPPPVHQH